jgi:hypothetical protein
MLDDPDIGAAFEQVGREAWRNACNVTFFLIPAASVASVASWNSRSSWRVLVGLPALVPGDNQRSCKATCAS